MSLYNVSTTPICLNSLIVNVNYFFLLEVNNFKHKKLKYIKKKKKKVKKNKKKKKKTRVLLAIQSHNLYGILFFNPKVCTMIFL